MTYKDILKISPIHLLYLAIPVISYLLVAGLYLVAMLNPQNNIDFIYGYGMFIVIAEFLSVFSSNIVMSEFRLFDNIFAIIILMFFVVVFSFVLHSIYPGLILGLSIIAKIFTNKTRLSTNESSTFSFDDYTTLGIFFGTLLLIAFSSPLLGKLLTLPESVLINKPANTTGIFVDTPQLLLIWGVLYFSLLAAARIWFFYMDIKNNNINSKNPTMIS
ncbi:MAG: hypothetical protein WCK26_01420 [Candidatus Saccharibacteria bacterium]